MTYTTRLDITDPCTPGQYIYEYIRRGTTDPDMITSYWPVPQIKPSNDGLSKYRIYVHPFAHVFELVIHNADIGAIDVRVAMRYNSEPAEYSSSHSSGFVNYKTPYNVLGRAGLAHFEAQDVLVKLGGGSARIFYMVGDRDADGRMQPLANAGGWFYFNVFRGSNACSTVACTFNAFKGRIFQWCDTGDVPDAPEVPDTYADILTKDQVCAKVATLGTDYVFSHTTGQGNVRSFRMFVPPKLRANGKLRAIIYVPEGESDVFHAAFKYGSECQQAEDRAQSIEYYQTHKVTLTDLRSEIGVIVSEGGGTLKVFEINDTGFAAAGAYLYVMVYSVGTVGQVTVSFDAGYEATMSFYGSTYESDYQRPEPSPGIEVFPEWNFYRQPDKYGYINNPRWTQEPAHINDHLPCGYWHKSKTPYYYPDVLPIWEPSSMCVDEENRKLYTTCVRNRAGIKYMRKVFETDLDQFRHTRCWGAEIPGGHDLTLIGPTSYPPYFSDRMALNHVWWNNDHGEGYYIPISQHRSMYIDVLNARTNVITSYDMRPGVGNTTYDEDDIIHFLDVLNRSPRVFLTRVNLKQKRLYVVLMTWYYSRRNLVIGYFDLTETSPPYTWHRVIYESNSLTQGNLYGTNRGKTPFIVSPEDDLMILCGLSPFSFTGDLWTGHVTAWRISSGSRLGPYKRSTEPAFPIRGMGSGCYAKGKLYGRIRYHPLQPSYRGLCECNLSNGAVKFHVPSYAPNLNNYRFECISLGSNNKLYINHYNYGIAEFDIETEAWRLLNHWEVPGLRSVVAHMYQGRFTSGVHYDNVTECVYSGYGSTLWNLGPWSRGEPNLHWMPTQPGFWACFIARHSVQELPPSMKIIEGAEGPQLPMIWNMPK